MRLILPLLLFLVLCLRPGCCTAQCPPTAPLSPPWLVPPAAPFDHHVLLPDGSASAHVYVDGVAGSNGLGRPFIFVEGIDFGLGSAVAPFQNGDYGWSAFQGCDLENYPMMAHMPVLLDSVRQRGFTPILIDFADGTADLSTNAAVLADILTHLREHRTDMRPMVLAGASMGGQLARMALRTLELSGAPHCQQLYVSLDSPHRGANVPLGLQHVLHFLSGDEGVIDGLVGALSSPAARQLLEWQVQPSGLRAEQQNRMDSLGYPLLCRNVAIANGGIAPLPGADSPLLDYDHALIESGPFGNIGELIRLNIHPYPGNEDHPNAMPGQPVLAEVARPPGNGWPWPLDNWTAHGWNPDGTSIIAWDHLPGGTRPSLQQFAQAFNATAADTSSAWPLCIPPMAETEYQALHSFIPTASALGLPVSGAPLTPASLAQSPFDAIHHGLDNEPHSEINPANLSFLLQQLDLVTPPILPGATLDHTNLNAGLSWKLPGFTVEGHVGLQSSAPEFDASASQAGDTGTFRLQGCSGPLHIPEGATLHLGASPEDGGSQANLVLEAGAVIMLEGHLIIHQGSTLDLNEGARLDMSGGQLDIRGDAALILHPEAEVHLSGLPNWSCAQGGIGRINGRFFLEPTAQWSLYWSGQPDWRTPHGLEITGAQGGTILMQAVSGTHPWVVGPGASWTVTGVDELTAAPMGLRLSGDSHVEWETAEEVSWRGSWVGTGTDTLQVLGDLSLEEVTASGILLAQSQGRSRMVHSSFVMGGASMGPQGTLQSSEFHDFAVALDLDEGSPSSLVEDCRFSGGTPIGLHATGGVLRLEDCAFDGLGIGLDLKSNAALLSCTRFENNDIAVRSDRSGLAMAPLDGGGWNRFAENDVHLRLLHAPLPSIQYGANHFGTWASHWAQGSVDLNCEGNGLDWDISGQSWNWPSGWPQVQSGLTASGPNGACPVWAVDLNPVDEQNCRAGWPGKRE